MPAHVSQPLCRPLSSRAGAEQHRGGLAADRRRRASAVRHIEPLGRHAKRVGLSTLPGRPVASGVEVRPQGGGSARLWSVVRVADGDAVELGNIAEGRLSPYWLLPYWADEGHLVLRRRGEGAAFDTETRRLSGVLDQLRGPEPGWLANGAQKHLVSYCVRHYASEMTLLRSALARISKDLDIQGYYQEHPSQLNTFCSALWGFRRLHRRGLEGRLFQPLELTCSPDGNDVARADLWKQGPLQPLQGGYSTVEGWGARLNVFDLADASRSWYRAGHPCHDGSRRTSRQYRHEFP